MTDHSSISTDTRKRPISLTVRSDLINEAKTLGLNTSRAAEAGIAAAVKEAKGKAWLLENQAAIEAYNTRIKTTGLSLVPTWAQD